MRPLLQDPHAYFGENARNLTRERIGRISSPVLIAQGDVPFYGVDHHKLFNEILIPELRAAGKEVEVTLYPGQRHCFGFAGGLVGQWTTDATVAAARDFFGDMDAFFRVSSRHPARRDGGFGPRARARPVATFSGTKSRRSRGRNPPAPRVPRRGS